MKTLGAALRLSLTVIVDDLLSESGVEAGAFPAHGIGALVELHLEEGSRIRLLLDGGPRPDVLVHNAEALHVDLDNVDAAIAMLWSSHHIYALLHLTRDKKIGSVYLPPLPKTRCDTLEKLTGIPVVLVPFQSPVYNERAALIGSPRGYVAFIACSVYGVDVALQAIDRALQKLNGKLVSIVGGFNLSSFDVCGLRLLVKFARSRKADVIPLHSTSIEAREKIAKAFESQELAGVGTRVVYE